MASTTHAPTRSFLSGWGNTPLSRLSRGGRSVVPVSPAPAAPSSALGGEGTTDGKRQTLFGPHIGGDEEDDEWADAHDGGGAADGSKGERESVSVETVKGWIERSKSGENPHPTTTLQSLVNLKRPTLSLVPLASNSATSTSAASHHILKFTYDASSPTVLISIRLILPSPTPTDPHLTVSEVVWAGQVPGGFGQAFVLPEEGAIDLGQATEHLVRMYEEEDAAEEKAKAAAAAAASEQPAAETTAPAETSAADASTRQRGLGGMFSRGGRGRGNDIEAQNAVPMAAVGMSATTGGAQEEKKKVAKKGVRVVIRLEARGETGESMANMNAQQTHLEITHSRGRSGTTATLSAPTVPAVEAEAEAAPIGRAMTEDEMPVVAAPEPAVAQGVVLVEGRRSTWSAKVIRREAIIGSHTFHLREIFGLTSSTTNQPTANSASYPPQPDDDPYASTPNECIICLVSPRDVVLLPCRHLVVCKECAIGMVEFGAGGKIMRREGEGEFGASETANTEAGATAGTTGTDGAAGEAGVTPVAAPTPAPTTGRRKKKAKGWQCPVCRLPYTSMLRIALPTTKPGLELDSPLGEAHTHHAGSHSTHSLYEKKDEGGHAHIEGGDYPPRSSSPHPTLPGRAESILLPDGPEEDEEEQQAAGVELGQVTGQTRPEFVGSAGEQGEAETEEERRRRVEKTV